MGGDIRMVVRFTDGSIHSQVRFTNNYPLWVRTPAFLTGDERVMRAYLAIANDEERKDPLVAPTDYGLYLIDHLTRQIVNASEWSSCQDTTLGDNHFMMYEALPADDHFPGHLWNFRRLLEGGFLSLRSRRLASLMEGQAHEPWIDHGPIEASFDRWDDEVFRPNALPPSGKRTHTHNVGIDFSRHWTVSSFRIREHEGAKDAALAKLDEIGFPLRLADRAGWEGYDS